VSHLPRRSGRSNYTIATFAAVAQQFSNFSSCGCGQHLDRFGLSPSDDRQHRWLTSACFLATGGWASLMAAVLLLSGVQLLFSASVGEYIGRLYLTANGSRNR